MEPLTEAEVLELSNLSKRKKRNIKQSLRYIYLSNKNTRYNRFIPRKTGQSRNFVTADKLVVDEEKENEKVNFY